MPTKRVTLRAQLLVVFLIATALVGVLVTLNASNSFDSAHRAASLQVNAEAAAQAQQLHQNLNSIPQYLATVVAQPAIRSLDPTDCRVALRNLGVLSVGAHVLIVGPHGRVVCSDGTVGRLRSLGNPAWLKDTFKHTSGVGGPMKDPTIDRVDVVYAMAFVSTGGRSVALVGLIATATMLTFTAHNSVDPFLVNATTGRIFATAPSDAAMVGSVIAAPTLTRLVDRHETVSVRGADGTSRITAGTRIDGTSWDLVAGLSSVAALAPARQDLHRNLEIGALIVLILLGLGLLMHRRITKPLRRLRSAMEHVAADSVDTRAPETGPAEFIDLAAAFNQMLDARAHSEARFRSLVRYNSDFVTVIDRDGFITYANPRAADAFHIDLGAGEPVAFRRLLDPDDQMHVLRLLQASEQARPAVDSRSEFRLVTPAGETRYVEANIQNLLDDPSVTGLVITCGDITDRKAAEDRLTHAALHDSLTGLPNRPLVMDRLSHVLARSARDRTLSAVLFLDLDSFKLINDTAGHGTGDALLVQVAHRLSSVCRPGDTLGRFGGDEFVVICDGLANPEDATTIAERLVDTRDLPYVVNGQEIFIGGSIGIALARPGDDASGLLRDADVAMYRAKASGRGSICVFDDEMRVATRTRLDIENALLHALDRDELSLHYQPLIALDDDRPMTLEALLRWTTADGAKVPPDRFIPVAEETGLIVGIGTWVLEESCRQLAEWRRAGQVPADLRLAVNVSARQLIQPDFPTIVATILARHDVPADQVVVEITESTIMSDAIGSIAVLCELRALGVRISIDDFGAGYSSLAYLQRLPIDELKIDRALVTPLSGDGRAVSIVESIVSLGHALGLTVIAEGVETEAQLRRLRRMGCDLAQGFLFSGPIPAVGVPTWLHGAHRSAVHTAN